MSWDSNKRNTVSSFGRSRTRVPWLAAAHDRSPSVSPQICRRQHNGQATLFFPSPAISLIREQLLTSHKEELRKLPSRHSAAFLWCLFCTQRSHGKICWVYVDLLVFFHILWLYYFVLSVLICMLWRPFIVMVISRVSYMTISDSFICCHVMSVY